MKMKMKIKMINDSKNMSSVDIEVIRADFFFLYIYKENFKHLKHKQKASK